MCFLLGLFRTAFHLEIISVSNFIQALRRNLFFFVRVNSEFGGRLNDADRMHFSRFCSSPVMRRFPSRYLTVALCENMLFPAGFDEAFMLQLFFCTKH